jgi:hypothetical protein
MKILLILYKSSDIDNGFLLFVYILLNTLKFGFIFSNILFVILVSIICIEQTNTVWWFKWRIAEF